MATLKSTAAKIAWTAFILCLSFTALGSDSKDYFEIRDRLQNARIVFQSTGKGRVAFLGGSITYNPGWRTMVCQELQRRFPETEFEFISAGISSTGSTPGAFRLTRDVFSNGPVDLLFEEAAVNDSTNGRSDKEQIRGMEGIIRHSRILNPNIDIIMMYFVDPSKMEEYNKGNTPAVIKNHDMVASHYNITSINLALEVTERINRGEFTWKDDFKNLHPSPFGQKIYFNAINRLFDQVWNTSLKKSDCIRPHKLPEKIDRFSYDEGRFLPLENASGLKGFKFVSSWKNTVGGRTREGFVDVPMLVGELPGDSFKLHFSGTAIGIFVAAGPDAGAIEYSIDSSPWKTQDLYTQWSDFLHIPWLYVLDAELSNEQHLLHLRISDKSNKESKGNACRIVHFAINSPEAN